jgi:hypothetical protein
VHQLQAHPVTDVDATKTATLELLRELFGVDDELNGLAQRLSLAHVRTPRLLIGR